MKLAHLLKRVLGLGLIALMAVALMPPRSRGQPTASQSLPEFVADIVPKGWGLFDKVKQFTAENLYEKIDGRAEFFLSYDMIRMISTGFINSANTGQFIDLSIYDMGTPTNAFGVFSVERSQGGPPLGLGRAGYRSDSNYYIWKGQYYIKIIASDASGELRRIGMNLARKVSDFLRDSGEGIWGLAALPLTDRLPDSVQYFKADAMGLDFMQNTYTARYRKGDAVVTAFLSRRQSPESARTTFARYTEYAKKYGKGIKRIGVGGVELVCCNMGGNYDVLFHKGQLMGGVFSVEDQYLAIPAAAELWRQLRDQ